MRWVWNESKNRANESKHGLDFETAQLVFDDPLAISRLDSYVILLVVHTWPVYEPKGDQEIGRIISARKATKQERRAYEQGNF